MLIEIFLKFFSNPFLVNTMSKPERKVELKPWMKLNQNSFKTFVKSIDEFLIFVRRIVTSLYSCFSNI